VAWVQFLVTAQVITVMYARMHTHTHVHMHSHIYIHSSDFWSTKAGTKWKHPCYLHLWSSGGLLLWMVGHCV